MPVALEGVVCVRLYMSWALAEAVAEEIGTIVYLEVLFYIFSYFPMENGGVGSIFPWEDIHFPFLV